MSETKSKSRRQEAEWRHLLDDARVLVDRYRKRGDASRGLTIEQRRAWAAETAALMDQMQLALSALLGSADPHIEAERRRMWLEMFVNGYRGPKPIPQDPADLRQPDIPLWVRADGTRRRL